MSASRQLCLLEVVESGSLLPSSKSKASLSGLSPALKVLAISHNVAAISYSLERVHEFAQPRLNYQTLVSCKSLVSIHQIRQTLSRSLHSSLLLDSSEMFRLRKFIS